MCAPFTRLIVVRETRGYWHDSRLLKSLSGQRYLCKGKDGPTIVLPRTMGRDDPRFGGSVNRAESVVLSARTQTVVRCAPLGTVSRSQDFIIRFLYYLSIYPLGVVRTPQLIIDENKKCLGNFFRRFGLRVFLPTTAHPRHFFPRSRRCFSLPSSSPVRTPPLEKPNRCENWCIRSSFCGDHFLVD